jgi:DNA-binding NtrC family response regulator
MTRSTGGSVRSNGAPDEHAHCIETYGHLRGRSETIKQLFTQLRRLETTKANVLISGESGTGKELIARAIHEHSAVRNGPLISVNCGALDRHLVRSELFGHVRGAFTGAVRRHTGAFESADGGTLFLDEIGELPVEVQPVLLRALELRRIVPVGSVDECPLDVRLIAASHRDLTEGVRAQRFREDLFYRIRVIEIAVPSLRQRPEDIEVLALWFAQAQGVSCLPAEVLRAFVRYHWPGNVRELRNAVEAFLAVGALPDTRPTAPQTTETALTAALDQFVDPAQTYARQKQELLRQFSRAYVERMLEETGGNQSEAARMAGLERSYLGRLVQRHGLRRNPEGGTMTESCSIAIRTDPDTDS